jgi:hypothetical protein
MIVLSGHVGCAPSVRTVPRFKKTMVVPLIFVIALVPVVGAIVRVHSWVALAIVSFGLVFAIAWINFQRGLEQKFGSALQLHLYPDGFSVVRSRSAEALTPWSASHDVSMQLTGTLCRISIYDRSRSVFNRGQLVLLFTGEMNQTTFDPIEERVRSYANGAWKNFREQLRFEHEPPSIIG